MSAKMPDSPPARSPLPPTLTETTPPSTRRIEIWRHEVASATLRHPTPPLPAPQGTWRRLEKRIRGRIFTGKANGNSGKEGSGSGSGSGSGNGSRNGGAMEVEGEKEEEKGQTRMYELSEREEAMRRLEAKAEEWSWDVEGGKETEGSSGGEVEKRRGGEKDARLERAAELLLRQRKRELREEEAVMEESRRVVV